MKQYIKTFVYGAIISIIMLSLSLIFWNLDNQLWLANFFLGSFSSSLFVSIFALLSYFIDRKNMLNKIKSFILYFDIQYEVLYLYKQKYKISEIRKVVSEISKWFEEIDQKRNIATENFFSFKLKLNKEIEIFNYKLTELFLSLVAFTEKQKEFSIYAWFLYLEEKLKIKETVKNLKALLNMKINKEQEAKINYFRNGLVKSQQKLNKYNYPKKK